MKKLTIRQIAQIKNTAKSVASYVSAKNKLESVIAAKQAELEDTIKLIDSWESAVVSMTGGYKSEDLLVRTVTDTGKVNKDGTPIKTTKYEPNTNILKFNEDERVYEIVDILTNEEPAEVDAEAEVEMKEGNEFDPTNV